MLWNDATAIIKKSNYKDKYIGLLQLVLATCNESLEAKRVSRIGYEKLQISLLLMSVAEGVFNDAKEDEKV